MNEVRQERLLDRIYDAAFDPGLWVGVMEELARELSGEAACMTSLDVFTGEGVGYTALVPEDTMRVYASRWSQHNPLHEVGDPLSYIGSWQPTTIRYEDWIEREKLHRSAFYNEFLRPIDSANGIMMGLALIGTTTVSMNIARSHRRDIFNRHEIACARRWQGHLSRAVRLGEEMRVSQSALDAVDQLVVNTQQRLFFLDGRGRIRRMSLAAEAMLAAGSQLHIADGVLSATLPDEERELRQLIAQAGSRNCSTLAGGVMQLRGSGGKSCKLSVTPLGSRGTAMWSAEPIILVTIANCSQSALPNELALRRRFGLTPAEARLTLALLQGGTLREVADSAALSINTVRAQLSAVFSKTGCNRQTDLVRTLLALEQGGV